LRIHTAFLLLVYLASMSALQAAQQSSELQTARAVSTHADSESGNPPTQADKQALDLLKRLLKTLSNIPPVRLCFEVSAESDSQTEERRLKLLQEQYASQGKTVVLADTTSPLLATWVYSGQSESVAPQADTQRIELYLAMPPGTIERVANGKYNIRNTTTAGPIRPFHFYVNAIGNPWGDLHQPLSVNIVNGEVADDSQTPDHRILDIQFSPTTSTRFYVQTDPLRVLRFEAFHKGDKFAEVAVDAFATDHVDPARHFPTRAHRILYAGGHEIRRDQLVCKSVEFLAQEKFNSKMLDVVLPASSEVYDTLLERTIQLTSPTSGIELLTKTAATAAGDAWVDIARDSPAEGRLSNIDRATQNSRSIRLIFIIVNVTAFVLLLLLLFRRHRS